MSGAPNFTSNEQLVLPAVLDACCGPRMMWFDKADPRALFIDKRRATYPRDYGTPATKGRAPIVVAPDVIADFTAMPFPNESFYIVVFDPPHLSTKGIGTGIIRNSYGQLPNDWRGVLQGGFRECFRVLKPHGVLIFKWAENNFPISEVLALTPEQPLFGHGTRTKTHWCVFMKEAA